MERLKIGIVGLNFGRHIVEQVSRGDGAAWFELAALCDLDGEKARAQAQPLGVDAYDSLRDLLARDDIPVIGLFTGPNGRARLIREIMAAGKDIITTKPFEANADEALAVLQEARQQGRVVHLNSPAPMPSGDLKQINAWREQYNLGRPVGCRLDVWGDYHEKANGSWYDDPELCPVAPIYRLGIYMINDLIRLLGVPETVQVLHSRIRTGRPTPDNAQLGIAFANGCLANIFASFCVDDGQYYANTMILNFERGTIYRNIGPLEYGLACDQGATMSLVTVTGERHSTILRQNVGSGSGHYQWENFHRAVKGELLEGAITPEEVALGVRVIEAMKLAERTGSSTAVAPL